MRPQEISFPGGMPVRAHVRYISRYPYHWHKAVEIIYVLEGTVYVDIGSENHLLNENHIAVVNTGELHAIHKSEEDNKLLILQIDSDFCEYVNRDFDYAFFYCCSPYHEGAEATEKYGTLKGYIASLLCLLDEATDKNRKAAVKNCLEKMLSHMINHFDYLRFGQGVTEFDKKQAKRIRKIYEHIMRSPNKRIGLTELAEACDLTLYHLSHDIRDKFGHSFQELMCYSKCEQAARLLLSTDKLIQTVAGECGFSDPKYLIKHFKRNFNCTPSQFRKLYNADEETLAAQVRYEEVPLSSALIHMKTMGYPSQKTGNFSGDLVPKPQICQCALSEE